MSFGSIDSTITYRHRTSFARLKPSSQFSHKRS